MVVLFSLHISCFVKSSAGELLTTINVPHGACVECFLVFLTAYTGSLRNAGGFVMVYAVERKAGLNLRSARDLSPGLVTCRGVSIW